MPPRRQPDLFAEISAAPTARDLKIIPQGRAPLSKEQQTFNRLLLQVQKLRDELTSWTEFESLHQQRIGTQLIPVLGELAQARRAVILRCAEILAGGRGSRVGNKTERRQLTAFLLELAEVHLMEAEGDDADVVAVYDRYAPRSFAQHQAEERRKSRAMMQEMFGIDIGEAADVDPTEAVLEAALREAEAAEREERERREASRRSRQGAKARQREAERAAAAEQAAREMSQSVREVYRKLASALHPDRGADDGERQRRHQLMQRVNQAYESHDLLNLLTLQLEIEQIDEDHLATVSSSRLRHYNQILRDQTKELKDEIAAITEHLELAMEQPPRVLTRKAVERDLERSVAEARRHLLELHELVEDLLDPSFRRRWLREYMRESEDETRMLQELEALLTLEDGIDFMDPGAGHSSSARRKTTRKNKRKRKKR